MESAKKEESAGGSPAPAAIYPITALSFLVAKTMPEIPHEYVVRTLENEAAYVALFNRIIEHGVHERWRGRRYQVLVPGRRLEILAHGRRHQVQPRLKPGPGGYPIAD
jgi:hypothetical protein